MRWKSVGMTDSWYGRYFGDSTTGLCPTGLNQFFDHGLHKIKVHSSFLRHIIEFSTENICSDTGFSSLWIFLRVLTPYCARIYTYTLKNNCSKVENEFVSYVDSTAKHEDIRHECTWLNEEDRANKTNWQRIIAEKNSHP